MSSGLFSLVSVPLFSPSLIFLFASHKVLQTLKPAGGFFFLLRGRDLEFTSLWSRYTTKKQVDSTGCGRQISFKWKNKNKHVEIFWWRPADPERIVGTFDLVAPVFKCHMIKRNNSLHVSVVYISDVCVCVCVCVSSSCAAPSSWVLDFGSCWTIRASSWSSVSFWVSLPEHWSFVK